MFKAVADGRPFLPSELYIGWMDWSFFSHINITSLFKLLFVSNLAHSIDKMDLCKVIMERDIQIQRNIANAMDKSKILFFFMNFM